MDMTTKAITNITLILIIVITGIFLNNVGKPYKTGLFTIHKITAVGLIYFIIRILFSIKYFEGMNLFSELLLGLCALSILGLLISGGLLSLNKSNELMLTIHRVSTFSFLSALSGIFYTFFHINY
jgi:hypothetical protein